MAPIALERLLELPVRVHGIQLGRPLHVLLDARLDRVVGIEVRCGDGAHRFLSYAVARLGEDEIGVTSALVLLDEGGLSYYHGRTRRIGPSEARGLWVDEHGLVTRTRTAA